MNNYCTFDEKNKYIIWQDYQITRHMLEEAHETCHGNWIEIQHLRDYIKFSHKVLIDNGIDVPPKP